MIHHHLKRGIRSAPDITHTAQYLLSGVHIMAVRVDTHGNEAREQRHGVEAATTDHTPGGEEAVCSGCRETKQHESNDESEIGIQSGKREVRAK